MIIIAANQDTVFSRLASAIGRPELVSDPRFSTHSARGMNQDLLDDLIGAWTKLRTIEEIETVMINEGVPVGRVYTAKEMLHDPHFRDRNSLIEVETERFGRMSMPAPAPKLSASPGYVRWAGPEELGSHTGEVLSEQLGLSEDEIADLRARGIV
jgi:formyl-CoA transferase